MARATNLRAIGYEPIVADADRAAFETLIGNPITEIGPSGRLVPAGDPSDLRATAVDQPGDRVGGRA